MGMSQQMTLQNIRLTIHDNSLTKRTHSAGLHETALPRIIQCFGSRSTLCLILGSGSTFLKFSNFQMVNASWYLGHQGTRMCFLYVKYNVYFFSSIIFLEHRICENTCVKNIEWMKIGSTFDEKEFKSVNILEYSSGQHSAYSWEVL